MKAGASATSTGGSVEANLEFFRMLFVFLQFLGIRMTGEAEKWYLLRQAEETRGAKEVTRYRNCLTSSVISWTPAST